MITLDELIEAGIEHAKKIVRLGKDLVPLCGVAAGDQHIVIAVPDYGDPSKKEMVREFLRAKLKELDAHAYTFVCEAWFTEFAKGHDPRREDPNYLPSEDVKRRRECVTVMGVDRKGTRRMVMLEIKRAKNGRVDFHDISPEFAGADFAGPLAELLPKVTLQ